MSTTWSAALAAFPPIFYIVYSFILVALRYLKAFPFVNTSLPTHLSIVRLSERIIGFAIFVPILKLATLLLISLLLVCVPQPCLLFSHLIFLCPFDLIFYLSAIR